MMEPRTDAELRDALNAAAADEPLARGLRFAMPSTDDLEAVRNAIAALSPTARELLSWVARHHGAVLRVADFREWAGVDHDEALEAIAGLTSLTAVHRTGRRGRLDTWRTITLAHISTRIADPGTGELEAVVITLGFWASEHPQLAAAWGVRPFDHGPSNDLWRRALGDLTDDE